MDIKIIPISGFEEIVPMNKYLTDGVDYVPMRFARTFSIVYGDKFHTANGVPPQVPVSSSAMTPDNSQQ